MNSAVIVAAGKGTRMGGDKLFFQAKGEPIIAHTWRKFDRSSLIDEIIIVIQKGQQSAFYDVAKLIKASTPFRLVRGGEERVDSVWNGVLETSLSAKLIVIHDAARPCVSEAIIANCLSRASEVGASAAASRMVDTIKSATRDLRIDGNVDRSRLWALQTPQVFRRNLIQKALAFVREHEMKVSDDASACQCFGKAVVLVENVSPNPKLTHPYDLDFIKWLLEKDA